MAKLTEKEREAFEKILLADLGAINAKFMNQIKDFWDIARKEVKKKRGWDNEGDVGFNRGRFNQHCYEIVENMRNKLLKEIDEG